MTFIKTYRFLAVFVQDQILVFTTDTAPIALVLVCGTLDVDARAFVFALNLVHIGSDVYSVHLYGFQIILGSLWNGKKNEVWYYCNSEWQAFFTAPLLTAQNALLWSVAKHYGCKHVKQCGLIANRRSQANRDFSCVRNKNCCFARCAERVIMKSSIAKYHGCKHGKQCGLIANRRSQENRDFSCVRNMNCSFTCCAANVYSHWTCYQTGHHGSRRRTPCWLRRRRSGWTDGGGGADRPQTARRSSAAATRTGPWPWAAPSAWSAPSSHGASSGIASWTSPCTAAASGWGPCSALRTAKGSGDWGPVPVLKLAYAQWGKRLTSSLL